MANPRLIGLCAMLVCAMLVCASCASTTKPSKRPQKPPPRSSGTSAAILVDVPITFEVSSRTLHTAMVHGKVNGVATKLILDTGSTDHVLTIDLARRASIESAVDKPGTDHSGASVPSWKLGEVSVLIGDKSFKLDPAIAIKGPPPFKGWGIGGFISPQRLHPTAFTVLDFVSNKLLVVEGSARAVRPVIQRRVPKLVPVVLDRSAKHVRPVIKAAVHPFKAVWACLNTGGRHTEFVESAVAGLESRRQGADVVGVSGTRGRTLQVENQILRVAEASFPMSKLLVRRSMQPDALIGMNVLKSTVLVLHTSAKQPVIWFVPAAATTSRTR
jgi:hypothetical protein